MTISRRRLECGRSRVLALVPALVLTFAPLVSSAQTEKDDEFSKANTLLFLTNHLDGISAPSVLHYVFEQRGTLEDEYKDTIGMILSAGGEQDKKNIKFKYFTGVRNQYVAPVSNAEGNPIITLFLQRDVNEMDRRTGGSWLYFQKVIKLALENDAEVKPVKFKYDGRMVDGTEIKITPYEDDPHRAQIAPYADKAYIFTLSKAVPGEVYELRSMVPVKESSGRGSGPLIEETLTLKSVESLTGGQAAN